MLNVRLVACSAALLFASLLSAQFIVGSGSAQGPQLSPPASSTPADQRCVVQGRVTNSQTGETLRKVSVRLTRRGSGAGSMGALPTSGPQGYSATSEADGSFRIENIEPGDYNLSGQRSGYLNTQYGAKAPMRQGTVLTLRPGQQLADINLSLNPQAVIAGKVVDEDGDPMTGAMVQVLGQMWQRGKIRLLPRGRASTNDLGEFRSANLPPGKYYLCAQRFGFGRTEEAPPTPGKPDIRPVRTCYPDAVALDAAVPVEVKAGQDLSGVDIRIHNAPTYHVRGKVAGNFAAGDAQRVSLNLLPREEQAFFFGNQTNANKDLTFDIPGVASGAYVLNVFLIGGNIQGLAHQPIDVGEGDVNDVVLTILPPGSLRGGIRVEGTPQAGATPLNLAGIHLSLSSADTSSMMAGPTPNGQSGPDGTFKLDNVFPGKYYVQINTPPGTYLKSIRFGQQEILGNELDLSQGAAGDLDILFRYGPAEVDGTVQAAENASAPVGASSSAQPASSTASILLVPDVLNADGSGMRFGNTNQNAAFTLKNVPPGHYRAYAFEEVNMNDLQNPEVLKQLESRGTEVELKENDRKQIQLPIVSADDMDQIFARLGLGSSQ